ncbi:MAG TPA: FkbM family methyltransferase [Gemmataceae bacterium]|jgi:FkbM family methyltransferase
MLKRWAVAICPSLPSYRARFGQWLGYRRQEARLIGASATARLWFARSFEAGRKGRLARIRPTGFRYPLYFRPGGSDPHVIDQVFLRREYACIAAIPGVEYIVDCGANIGCSTYYLLHHYPKARALVVEPDASNMAVCRRNLAPFGDRVIYIGAGIWSAAGSLVIDRGKGAEWAIQVRLAQPSERADIPAVTIADVMALANFPRIDVLKIDIEGAEAEVFGESSSKWLPAVRNMAIELHGNECEGIVEAAMSRFPCAISRSGELTVFRGMTSLPR